MTKRVTIVVGLEEAKLLVDGVELQDDDELDLMPQVKGHEVELVALDYIFSTGCITALVRALGGEVELIAEVPEVAPDEPTPDSASVSPESQKMLDVWVDGKEETPELVRPRLPGCPGDASSALACCGRIDCEHLEKDIAALIRTFHTLESRGVTSVEGARAIAGNASNSRGTRAAAAFVLHVVERAPFDLATSWAAWDREQREAYAAWEASPWWMIPLTSTVSDEQQVEALPIVDPLDVACPRCEAPPGTHCLSGVRPRSVHAERHLAAAREALQAQSPAGTVRLLYPDGSHRDVDLEERCAWGLGALESSTLVVSDHRGETVETRWGRCTVEDPIDEAARERAARVEAERHLATALAALKPPLTRYWMCWIGADVGPTPFRLWLPGTIRHRSENEIYGVVDAVNEEQAWLLVAQYWPEMELRFCEAKPADWRPPADRFPWREDGQAEGGEKARGQC